MQKRVRFVSNYDELAKLQVIPRAAWPAALKADGEPSSLPKLLDTASHARARIAAFESLIERVCTAAA